MSDQEIGGGAATSKYRHPLVTAMNSFVAPLFQAGEAGPRGRCVWVLR